MHITHGPMGDVQRAPTNEFRAVVLGVYVVKLQALYFSKNNCQAGVEFVRCNYKRNTPQEIVL